MTNFPDIKDIAGKHYDVYEAYYRSLDPKNLNKVEAMDAARFLKKSGLSDVILSRVWDLSDPNGKGFLDKPGFFAALKLVSLAQFGETINVKNLLLETNAPKCGDVPKMKPPPVPKMVPISSNTDWSIKPEEKTKYQHLFNSLQPDNGILPGNKVKGLLMDSKLPIDTLSTIWELADQDKDGSLDEHEFVVAMHLVYKALDSRAIPSTLPKELQKPPKVDTNDFGAEFVANFPTDIVPVAPVIPPSRPPAPAIQPMPVVPLIPALSNSNSTIPKGEWVLTTIEKLKYQEVFEKSDLDKDGLVSGLEIKDVFLKSGLPQNTLAHIWALCDTNQTGKLNSEQFALAMWLVDRKKKGFEPPHVLAPDMVPPSMRPNAAPVQPPKPMYTNPELEMISKEIEELTKERHAIEAEVAQKEADIRIKTGEMKSLQSELDTLTATLKQLETQKGAANTRLDDLKTQQFEIDNSLKSVNQELKETQLQVNKLRDQCQKQEETIKEQEGELDSRRLELQKLKEEEQSLEKEYDKSLKEKELISVQLQETQIQISQVRAMVSQLEEVQRQMKDALQLCKLAIEEDNASVISDYSLSIEPEFRDFKKALMSPEEKAKDAFNSQAAFKSDPFKPTTTKTTTFEDSFESKGNAFGDDDSWGAPVKDPFNGGSKPDPFASAAPSVTPAKDTGKDDFGSDPFAILHAPTAGSSPMHAPESPSPALPPKKAKQPPPRPAPPRPSQGPKTDAFGSSSFANFEDFDIKASPVMTEPPNIPTAKVAPMEPAASDFQEDPFKNYRYEDPFMISDPFQEEAAVKVVTVETKAEDLFDKFTFDDEDDDTDPFTSSKAVKTNGNDGNNNFDPFSTPVSNTKSAKETSDFGFDANFANFDAFNSSNTNGTDENSDTWSKMDQVNNNDDPFGDKIKKSSQQRANKINKFSEDYSDNFDEDLASVLKRSVVEK